MFAWLKKLLSAFGSGAAKVAGNKEVQAIGLAAGEAALGTMSPQAQAVAGAALALAPTVHQLVQQVGATHDALQAAAAHPALAVAAENALNAGAKAAATQALSDALAAHADAVVQLQQVSSALNTVVGVAQALKTPAPAPGA
jgi:hypothetical protein